MDYTDNYSTNEPIHTAPEVTVSNERVMVRYAGFWMRFWAYLVDLLVIGSLERIIVKPLFHLLGLSTNDGLLTLYGFVSALVFYAYFVFMTRWFGQTLGKMIFGLQVIDLKDDRLRWSTIIFREVIGRYVAKTIFLIGYLLVAFLPQKQGLHDYFAGTTVIHRS
ncbi:RDD family protein [Priestia koreensis]|uniref:RDD family protein n=1 Tax=Priestia koreensis TaxID=284581 RepID=UPI0028F72BA3|nr:RDD family protein [Priestia koreensis]